MSILVESQRKMMEMFNSLSDRITNIEKTILSSGNISTSASDGSSSVEEKCRITPQLSFDLSRIKDEHNQNVKKFIKEEIC